MSLPKWLSLLVCCAIFPVSALETTYRVQQGDTLYGIARRRGVPLKAILALNPDIKQPNQLRVGQSLVVGTARPQVATAPPTPQRAFTVVSLPNRGLPGNLEGAAAIGCGHTYEPALTLLAPKESPGLTIDTQPTFYWVTPKLHWKDVPMEKMPKLAFILQELNSEGQPTREVFKTVFLSSGPAEITRLTLPKPWLDLDKTYLWTVNILCDPNNVTQDAVAAGRVRRVLLKPDLQTRMMKADANQRIVLFKEAGLWFDTLRTAHAADRLPETLTEAGFVNLKSPPVMCWQGDGSHTALCPG